jgi:iron complex outermembrane receptor protein
MFIRWHRGVVRVVSLLALALGVTHLSAAPAAAADDQSLKNLSLEELGNIEVTTLSKQPEEIWQTPAAIQVITAEDIRRSGATSLPEILRMAPGLDVARIDSTHWSVGVRGFGDQFSKSVLVLIDGRSVYTPLLAGVFWGLQDTMIEDIDRIEIIRGPGGTIWGANAVNGVINIVTKSASQTTGALASITTGNVDQITATARYGGHAHGLDYRVYAKGFHRGPQDHRDGQSFDTWRMRQAGGRIDWQGYRDDLTVQGDLYNGRIGQSVEIATYMPPAEVKHYEPFDAWGGNVRLFWRRTLSDDSHLQVQTYYDRTHFLAPQLGESRHTFDVDALHEFSVGPRHRISWGGGLRVSPSDAIQTVETLTLSPANRTATIGSAFAQDQVTIVPGRLSATVGAKFEHDTYTGLEAQPSARLIWTPAAHQSFWTSVTRAVRTPSRLERDFALTGFLDPGPPPFYVRILGNPDFESEQVVGYEGGYRTSVARNVYVDVAVFHNTHDNLEALGASSIVPEFTPEPAHALLIFPYANGVAGTSDGFEISPSWRPLDRWELSGYYDDLRLDLHNKPGNTDAGAVATYEGSSPRHQVMLQSRIDVGTAWEFDQTVRHVSALPARAVPAYTAAGLRFGWHRDNRLRVSLVADNLFDAAHDEFGHDPGPVVAIRRSVALTATWMLP